MLGGSRVMGASWKVAGGGWKVEELVLNLMGTIFRNETIHYVGMQRLQIEMGGGKRWLGEVATVHNGGRVQQICS